MAKLSAKYEILYIIDPAQGEEGIAALVEKFKSLAEGYGEVTSVDEWGKRRLAYPINDLVEGYYVYMTCDASPRCRQSLTVSSRSRKASCVPSSSPSKSKEAFSC